MDAVQEILQHEKDCDEIAVIIANFIADEAGEDIRNEADFQWLIAEIRCRFAGAGMANTRATLRILQKYYGRGA